MEDYLWLDVPLDPANKIHFATICQLMVSSNTEGIPYGIGIGDSYFSKQGNFIPGNNYAGLTCATFVMKLFHDQGYFIVDINEWKKRKSDKKWQLQILQEVEDYLKKENLWNESSINFIAYQKGLMRSGCARYKPEEIAAAAMMKEPPHGPAGVKKTASQILTEVVSHAIQLAKNRSATRLLTKADT